MGIRMGLEFVYSISYDGLVLEYIRRRRVVVLIMKFSFIVFFFRFFFIIIVFLWYVWEFGKVFVGK